MRTSPHEESLHFAGPTGRLEARIQPIRAGRPMRGGVLLCHPHPLFGGSLDNKILYRLARRIPEEADVLALRFNFRGVGRSEGGFDGGRGEIEDARAALDLLASRVPGLPLFAVGFSFGAIVGLRAASEDGRVTTLISLGLPLRGEWDRDFLLRTTTPRFFVQGENDEFGSGEKLVEWLRGTDGRTETRIVPAADHLFSGVEDEAVDAVVGYIRAHCSSL